MQALIAALVVLPAVAVAMTDPSTALPSWTPLAFGAMILVTLVLVIYQTVRYFRNNRDD